LKRKEDHWKKKAEKKSPPGRRSQEMSLIRPGRRGDKKNRKSSRLGRKKKEEDLC